jgi:IS605 OrfB family transposase
MDITLQTQLLPDAEQAQRFKATVERFNEAANWLAGEAFTCKISNKFLLQRLFYKELRHRFGLPADMAIRCIAEVANAFKRDKSQRPKFRKHAAVPYSMGKNICFKGTDRVSIGGLQGRIIVPFLMGEYQKEQFARAKGQCDLVLRHDGKWFLLVSVAVPEATQTPITDFLGVDLGVANIAFDSDGQRYTSEPIEAKRRKYAARRRSLGKATKGADRNKRRRCRKALARTKAKEARFRRDINHQISKRLVASAKGTGRGIALEDLEGIRERITVCRQQRDRFHAWAFDQLGRFIVYKGKLAGVLVAFTDPAYTSQTCSACGHCAKANRKSQAEFVCQACGYTAHADFNAARNHRDRARVHVKAPLVTERGEQRMLALC